MHKNCYKRITAKPKLISTQPYLKLFPKLKGKGHGLNKLA